MTTPSALQAVQAELRSLTQRMIAFEQRVEQRQLRFMRVWIATHLTSATSTPTAPTPPSSTATSAASPTTALASTRFSLASLWRHAREHMPKLLGWVLEKALQYLLPLLVSLCLAGWALLRRSGIAVADWFAGWWHWLLP